MSKVIGIHESPDMDCSLGFYLLTLHEPFKSAVPAFINLDKIDEYDLSKYDALIDCGGVFDPSKYRYDHHQLAREEQKQTCAAMMVWDDLINRGVPVEHLKELVNLVKQGDWLESEAKPSRLFGIHALLSAYKHENNDWDTLTYILAQIRFLDAHWQRIYNYRAKAESKVVFRSTDNKLVGLIDSTKGHSTVIMEGGADVVVFVGVEEDGSIPRGIVINPEIETPYVSQLMVVLKNRGIYPSELDSWFIHPAGFFAGKGTSKGKTTTPLPDESKKFVLTLCMGLCADDFDTNANHLEIFKILEKGGS